MAESLFGQSVSFLLFVAGAILLVAEAFAPGAHLFVLGVALLTAGLVGLAMPGGLGILAPVLLGVVVLVVTGLTLWAYRKVDIYDGEGAAETSHSGSLRGTFGTVTERVTPSEGEVKLEDGGFNPFYRARSTDGEIAVGTEVMVVDPGGGNVVTVEPVDGTDEIDRELARERAGAGDRPADERTAGERTADDERTTDSESATDSDDPATGSDDATTGSDDPTTDAEANAEDAGSAADEDQSTDVESDRAS